MVIKLKNKNLKPVLLGGIGEINFGKQYRQGNRVYSSENIAMPLQQSKDSYVLLIDDTYGYDGIRAYDETCPTLRSERNGLKIIIRN